MPNQTIVDELSRNEYAFPEVWSDQRKWNSALAAINYAPTTSTPVTDPVDQVFVMPTGLTDITTIVDDATLMDLMGKTFNVIIFDALSDTDPPTRTQEEQDAIRFQVNVLLDYLNDLDDIVNLESLSTTAIKILLRSRQESVVVALVRVLGAASVLDGPTVSGMVSMLYVDDPDWQSEIFTFGDSRAQILLGRDATLEEVVEVMQTA